jgi:hypothetical protein
MSDVSQTVAASPSAGEITRRIAHDLLLRSGEISARISEQVLASLPQLAPEWATDAVDAVRESTDQNIGAILSTLAFGVPASATEPPLGARKLMRLSLAAGAEITDLLRAYRLGHNLIWEYWSEHVSETLAGDQVVREVLSQSGRHIFTFIDRSCEHLVAEYRAEFGRVRPAGLERLPAEIIQELLGDGPVDESAASAALHHDVRGYHVALVAAPLGANGDPRHALEAIKAESGGSMLVLPIGDGTWWAWVTWAAEPADDRLMRMAACRKPEVLVTMGSAGRGRTGFRRSHEQAAEADRVARLSRAPRATVVLHRDIELAGVLCTDPERAHELALDRLGPLARGDATCERLRETVLTYLTHGCSKTRTADLMHIHHKTVSYRLAQAEELLGGPLTDDVLELGAALLAHRTLYGT